MTDPRLCLALDVPDLTSAVQWVEQTHHVFGVYKVGLQLFCAEGPGIIGALRRAGASAIFLDLKLHDIPNTVGRAVERLADVGVDLLTIHTGGGRAMMEAAARASGPITLLGVTVLTSLDEASMGEAGLVGTPSTLARQRALLADEAGLGGLVCSPLEASELREATAGRMKLVTPGIRLAEVGAVGRGDQKRIADPSRALAAGSDILVIGRAITAAADLAGALEALRGAVGAT